MEDPGLALRPNFRLLKLEPRADLLDAVHLLVHAIKLFIHPVQLLFQTAHLSLDVFDPSLEPLAFGLEHLAVEGFDQPDALISAGNTTGSIVVTVNGDTKYEADEAFTVTLSNVTGTTEGDTLATGERALVAQLLAAHRPSAIVHFAAESHVDRSIHGPGEFVRTNVALRLAVAPIYFDGEVGFRQLLSSQTHLGIGINGGGYGENYYEVRQGHYYKDESFNGHGGGASLNLYHLANPGHRIPLHIIVQGGARRRLTPPVRAPAGAAAWPPAPR